MMRQSALHPGKWILTVGLILLGAAWVAAIAALLWGIGATTPPMHAKAGTGPRHVYVTLQTFPNTPTAAWMAEHHYTFATNAVPPLSQHPTWVRYGPNTNIIVPAHSLVTMTVENYDGATPLYNLFYTHPQGTIGGTMTVNGKTVNSVASTDISHTFTIHSIPSSQQPWLFVSAPMQGEPDAVESAGADNGFPPHPIVMQFSFNTGAPGSYIWQCFDPCGWAFNGFGGPMQTKGYMSGTFVVQG